MAIQILFHGSGIDLAPLTTVGNLVSFKAFLELCERDFHMSRGCLQPFRRLCTSLGADITCGESKPLNIYRESEP